MFEVVSAGLQTIVEDWPGRVGYLDLGIPPGGPMDHLSHRLANLIVGNRLGEATLEIMGLIRPFQVKFKEDSLIALAGVDLKPKINDKPAPMWAAVKVKDGDSLSLGSIEGRGLRTYLAVAGGIDVPAYLGSKATCLTGAMGGYEGRALRAGDIVRTGKPSRHLDELANRKLKKDIIPSYGEFEINVILGPQIAPDYFREEDIKMFLTEPFKIDRNSSRTGYRLIPSRKWLWARKDGGVAGAHPSNILDNGYAVPGAINACGDAPIILMVDGPSAGGYVCIATVIYADLWKVGQAFPGKDTLRFRNVSQKETVEKLKTLNAILSENSVER